jgi:catechol-2,3-dioxygenase
VSDGHIMVSLWQLKNDAPVHFDRHANIGLHHVALMLDKENDLNIIHEQLLQHAIEIEFSPEPLGKGPARHLMCLEPSGIRVEFIWPGNT